MSQRDTMLHVAELVIRQRAELDGYRYEYDPKEDPEGYIISILIGLHHWCDEHGKVWADELSRAQELFETDLAEIKAASGRTESE